MDFFMQSIFLIMITLVISIFVLNRKNLDGTKTLPQGSFGWPIVNETYQFLFKKIDHFLQEKQKKHSSDIFKTKLLGEPTVVLYGPSANKFVSTSEPKHVKVWYLRTQRMLFNLPDHDQPRAKNSAVVAAAPVKILGFLKPEGLFRYMGCNIESIMHQHFMRNWEGKTELKVYPLVKSFALSLAYQFYLGIDDPLHVAKFVSKFDDLYSGIYAVPANFPGTTFHRAMKAASKIREEIQLLINKKIDCLSKGIVMNDLLAHLVGAVEDGKYVPKIEISNIIMGLMNSSYTSIAITLAFMIKHIGLDPHIYQKIVSEHADITKSKGAGAALDWDSIQKMKYTWCVTQETMRLYPTAPGAFREAVTDITFEGFTIPKGWKIFWAMMGTNKNSKYFDEAESFDPSRFEENGPVSYSYIPFGAGARSCPGKDYTRFVILTFIHNLVTKFSWQVMHPHEQVLGSLVPLPANGIPIRIRHL
ncbi:beta-amyrin 28-monooxygenase-like [Arachis stenosperma]|uniref:beta-amyrin 28-monooxygenase-like n=1 Tax=Arachis stenosperma TaxID=217475 RepID=UPI0025ACF3CF|nr:beta-amyrin 28-monooxygenase-like [Arachis stenosperma]